MLQSKTTTCKYINSQKLFFITTILVKIYKTIHVEDNRYMDPYLKDRISIYAYKSNSYDGLTKGFSDTTNLRDLLIYSRVPRDVGTTVNHKR